MRLFLTDQNGPYIDFADRALGFHREIIERTAQDEATQGRRKAVAYAAACVSGYGGDLSLVDPSLNGWKPELPTLRDYLDNDDAAAFVGPRTTLLMLLSSEQAEEAANHCLGLLGLAPGEEQAPGDSSES